MPSSMIGDVNTNAVLNSVLLHNNNGDGARSPSFLMPSWLVLPLPSASARSRIRGARAAPLFIFYRGGHSHRLGAVKRPFLRFAPFALLIFKAKHYARVLNICIKFRNGNYACDFMGDYPVKLIHMGKRVFLLKLFFLFNNSDAFST